MSSFFFFFLCYFPLSLFFKGRGAASVTGASQASAGPGLQQPLRKPEHPHACSCTASLVDWPGPNILHGTWSPVVVRSGLGQKTGPLVCAVGAWVAAEVACGLPLAHSLCGSSSLSGWLPRLEGGEHKASFWLESTWCLLIHLCQGTLYAAIHLALNSKTHCYLHVRLPRWR